MFLFGLGRGSLPTHVLPLAPPIGSRPASKTTVGLPLPSTEVTIRDGERVFRARVHEVTDAAERARLWSAAVKAYPPYAEYQQRTERQIPVFAAEPL